MTSLKISIATIRSKEHKKQNKVIKQSKKIKIVINK